MKWSKNSLKNGDNMHNRPLSGQRTGKQNTKISLLRLLHFPSLFMFCFCFTLPHFRFPHPLLSLSLLSRNHVIKLVGICNHVCNGRTVYATAEFVLDLNCSIVKIRPLLLRRLLPTNMLSPPTYLSLYRKKNMWNFCTNACNVMLQCNTHAKAIF